MRLRPLIIWPIAGAIVVGLGVYWLSTLPRSLAADLPELPEPAPLAPLPTVRSVVNVPVSLPILTLRDELRRRMPSRITVPRSRKSFTITVPLTGGVVRFCRFTEPVTYQLTQPTLTRSDQRLKVRVSGTARRVRFGVRLGRCGTTFGNPSFNFRDVRFNAEVTSALRVASDWDLELRNRRVSFDLTRVMVRLPIIGRWNIAGLLEDDVEPEAKRMIDARLTSVVASVDTHVRAARTVWRKLCRALELDAASGLYVKVKPTDAYIERPRLSSQQLTVNVGLRLRTTASLPGGESQSLSCPFPRKIGNRIPGDPGFRLAVPTDLTYVAIDDVLESQVAGVELARLDPVSVVLRDIGLDPYGQGVLITVKLQGTAHGRWFRGVTLATVYLAAVPKLDPSNKTVEFTDLSIDTSSQDVLVAMAGEALEPLLLSYLKKRATVDLKPVLAEASGRVDAALATLSAEEALEASLTSLNVTSVEVGPDRIRLIVRIDGSVTAQLDRG